MSRYQTEIGLKSGQIVSFISEAESMREARDHIFKHISEEWLDFGLEGENGMGYIKTNEIVSIHVHNK